MNSLVGIVLGVVLVGSALSVPVQRVKRWSLSRTIVEPSPGLSGADLREVLATTPDIRFTDWEKRLTALKSGKFKACFLVNFDPDFYLPEPDMDQITMEKVPEVVDSPPAYYAFLEKAGPFLTAMCERTAIYWLKDVAPTLPVDKHQPNNLPQASSGRSDDMLVPVNHDPPSPPPIRQEAPTPPPVALFKHQQHREAVETPPPVDQYRQPLDSRQEGHPAMTPPPLTLWRLRHGN